MKRIISNILLLLTAAASIVLLFYPHISNMLAARKQSFEMQEYVRAVEDKTGGELLEEWERAIAYNEGRMQQPSDPFGRQQESIDSAYLNLLNIEGNGEMGYIRIPKIQVSLPIYHGTSDTVLNTGSGHLEGSALPVGGKGTHCVLTGHSGLNFARMFSDLEELTTGDEFYLYILDQVLAYRIDQITVTEPEDTRELYAEEGRDYVTLITCTPYGINSHRLLLRGERTDYSIEDIENRIKTTRPVIGAEVRLLITAVLALLVFGIIISMIIKIRKSRKI